MANINFDAEELQGIATHLIKAANMGPVENLLRLADEIKSEGAGNVYAEKIVEGSTNYNNQVNTYATTLNLMKDQAEDKIPALKELIKKMSQRVKTNISRDTSVTAKGLNDPTMWS